MAKNIPYLDFIILENRRNSIRRGATIETAIDDYTLFEEYLSTLQQHEIGLGINSILKLINPVIDPYKKMCSDVKKAYEKKGVAATLTGWKKAMYETAEMTDEQINIYFQKSQLEYRDKVELVRFISRRVNPEKFVKGLENLAEDVLSLKEEFNNARKLITEVEEEKIVSPGLVELIKIRFGMGKKSR